MSTNDLLTGPDPEVFTYQLFAPNGKPVRMATGVRFSDGHTVRFMERLTKREATAQGWRCRANGIGDQS